MCDGIYSCRITIFVFPPFVVSPEGLTELFTLAIHTMYTVQLYLKSECWYWYYICHTLRSWPQWNLTSTWTLSPGLENNNTLKCITDKGKLLFSSVEQVEVIVQNFKFRSRLFYWSNMHHILETKRFEGLFLFVYSKFPTTKKYFFKPYCKT